MTSQESDNRQEKNGTFDVKTFTSPFPNPYHWPAYRLNVGLVYNGVIVFRAPVNCDPVTQVKKCCDLPMREDDILLATFPKSGSHWTNEILCMLLHGTTDYSKSSKQSKMLEIINDMQGLETLPSPRLLNSHNYFAHLPTQIVEKRVKIVHVIRNPRDVATSWYHHMTRYCDDKFNFENFLKGYMIDDYTANGHQFNYLRQMKAFESAHPDHPIIHIHYEDLQRDPVPVLQRLAKFLGVEASGTFCQQVIEACSFENLKEVDHKGKKISHMFRKGIVGDWKNNFTVAQSEMFDEFIRQQRKIGGFNDNFRSDH